MDNTTRIGKSMMQQGSWSISPFCFISYHNSSYQCHSRQLPTCCLVLDSSTWNISPQLQIATIYRWTSTTNGSEKITVPCPPEEWPACPFPCPFPVVLGREGGKAGEWEREGLADCSCWVGEVKGRWLLLLLLLLLLDEGRAVRKRIISTMPAQIFCIKFIVFCLVSFSSISPISISCVTTITRQPCSSHEDTGIW